MLYRTVDKWNSSYGPLFVASFNFQTNLVVSITMNAPVPIRQPSARSITSPTPSERGASGSVRLTPAQSADQRKARREQLRNFYGIKEGVSGPSGVPITRETGDPKAGDEAPGDAGQSGDPLDLGECPLTLHFPIIRL